ncbi:hypothetical protein Goarm_001548 [Gossypium armourianum]|uniref:Tim10-like domain-containing protein n=1 Tax=Gossypium armourianum TaxID=34283 RepID=A0A7J9KDI5_9ROSI|nr:hypothetical protein [Gossypium armourianum]
MLAALEGLPEEDKARMSAMIDHLQLRDRPVRVGLILGRVNLVNSDYEIGFGSGFTGWVITGSGYLNLKLGFYMLVLHGFKLFETYLNIVNMEINISFLWRWGRIKKVGVGSRLGTIDGYAIVVFTDSSALLTRRWMDIFYTIEEIETRPGLRMYNSLVERCFTDCIDNFTRKTLQKQEETCVTRCAEKFLKHSMRVGMRFAELNSQAATQD